MSEEDIPIAARKDERKGRFPHAGWNFLEPFGGGMVPFVNSLEAVVG